MRSLERIPEPRPSDVFVVVCFGFESDRLRRQPWHVAHGLAQGLVGNGHAVTVITDALQPPQGTGYALAQIPRLIERGRASAELSGLIERLAPKRAFVITGLRELAALRRLPWTAPTSLVLASPRLRPEEILRLGPTALWRERHVLTLPLVNALLPSRRLRRGVARSGADEIVYLSQATRARLSAQGLPPGRLLRPQVEPFSPPEEADEPVVAFIGPPLATRGVFLALDAFETAVEHGAKARLLMLLRPDVRVDVMDRVLRRIAASPVRERIEVETAMLDRPSLRQRLKPVRVMLLPFRAPVSDVPLVVLEAALSGRRVVVLEAPGVAEYASTLGGVVAKRPADLPDALICALHRPDLPAEPRSRWTSWPDAVAGMLDPASGFPSWRMIALCGVDGSGKTTLLKALERRLRSEGVATRHVWSRFRNYLSKPLLALARLTGHNRKAIIAGTRVGYHDFAGRPLLAWPFLLLQLLDNLIDLKLRYGGRTLVLGDRCVLDTVVDLAVDTGFDDLLIDRLALHLKRRLPSPHLVCLVERHPARIGEDRPDAFHDRDFARRQALFRRLADRLDLPVIDNNGSIDEAVERVWRLAQGEAK